MIGTIVLLMLLAWLGVTVWMMVRANDEAEMPEEMRTQRHFTTGPAATTPPAASESVEPLLASR